MSCEAGSTGQLCECHEKLSQMEGYTTTFRSIASSIAFAPPEMLQVHLQRILDECDEIDAVMNDGLAIEP